MSEKIHDLIVVGGGPAGLTAGLYACRSRMDTLLIEKMMPGGQVLVTYTVDNYPGFPGGITGPELMQRMEKQAADVGLLILHDEVTSIGDDLQGPARPRSAAGGEIPQHGKRGFLVKTASGEAHTARAVIIATGAEWRKLGIPGEKEFTGRGVSYCGTCDGPLFRNKDIVVIGGGDTAAEEALFLTRFASKVTLVHRRDRLRAAKILQEQIAKNEKCRLLLKSVPVEICGGTAVEHIKVKDVATGETTAVPCQGVFIFVGLAPVTAFIKGRVKTDEKGYIITDGDMRTSADGIFACGDVRAKSLRQIVVAAGEGAQAAYSAQQYIEGLKGIAYI